jgi:hypothetical protein
VTETHKPIVYTTTKTAQAIADKKLSLLRQVMKSRNEDATAKTNPDRVERLDWASDGEMRACDAGEFVFSCDYDILLVRSKTAESQREALFQMFDIVDAELKDLKAENVRLLNILDDTSKAITDGL